MKFKVVPYGKWWQHLLKGKLYMVYRAVFGWKRDGAYGSPLVLDNLGIEIKVDAGRQYGDSEQRTLRI